MTLCCADEAWEVIAEGGNYGGREKDDCEASLHAVSMAALVWGVGASGHSFILCVLTDTERGTVLTKQLTAPMLCGLVVNGRLRQYAGWF